MTRQSDQYGYLNNKKFKLSVHVLIWVILVTFPYILNKYRLESMGLTASNDERKFIRLDLLMYVYWIAVYYLNNLLLVPRLLLNRRYAAYLLIVSALMFCSIFADMGLRMAFGIHNYPFAIICYFRLPIYLLDIVAGIAATLIATQQRYLDKMNEINKEGLKTELSFLRSQMSPHFIFNVLNNIVSLVRSKSKELEPTVMKLSALMQYVLYDIEEETVTLKTETEYLINYIELQKQRFSRKVKIVTEFMLFDENVMVEPLLLIPFVENAFKHGTGIINDPEIIITLKSDEQDLYFTVVNKYDPSGTVGKDPSSGIGIANVRRRLDLLYVGSHKLDIAARGDRFEISLTIKLKHD